uniref:hypothetical protein n=1 Tax=Exserohilum turcicum TaxID=93612 RepID=UPI0020012E95|nr:hypothetical protein M1I11_mgp066 [Exserohilum turcicum]UOU81415.1 hypothetical protein [Exserohilum turcicum]
MVTIQKISEKIMGHRGSKSEFKLVDKRNLMLNSVKEQRVDGSLCGNILPHIRCTLAGFERNYKVKILSNLINYTTFFSLIFFLLRPFFFLVISMKLLTFSLIYHDILN